MAVQEQRLISSADYRIGAILSETFRVLASSPAKYLGIAAISAIPTVIGYLLVGFSALTPAAGGAAGWVVMLAAMVCALIAQAIITFGAFESLRGRGFDVGHAVSNVFTRMAAIALLSLALGLLVTFGMVLLLVPGLILMCMYFVSVPVCVVERADFRECFARSRKLTSGYRWKILGQVASIAIPLYILIFLVTYTTIKSGNPLVGLWIGKAFGIFIAATMSILSAVTYFRLRNLQEGVDLERIAAVFE